MNEMARWERIRMAMKVKKWAIFFAFFAILTLTGCDDRETEGYGESNYYSIDSASILHSLDRGDTNVFKLLDPAPQAMPITSPGSAWSQKDYLRVLRVIFLDLWHESLDLQQIYSMAFRLKCSEIGQGLFSEADFYSYYVIKGGKGDTRRQFYTDILPSAQIVYTSKREFTPNIYAETPIDLTSYRVSPEEALGTAEKNGGAKNRLKYKNDCAIQVDTPGTAGKGWLVTYEHNQGGLWYDFFEFTVDPRTGAYEVVYSKP
jgi:hypothetical protein